MKSPIPTTKRGFVLWPWLIIFTMLIGLLLALLFVRKELSEMTTCRDNLKRIYLALELYHDEHNQFPAASIYPYNPLEDKNSLFFQLKPFGLEPASMCCPSTGQAVKKMGASYLWNATLNETSWSPNMPLTWMLIEIESLQEQINGPHLGSFHVLYTDGTIERLNELPKTLNVPF